MFYGFQGICDSTASPVNFGPDCLQTAYLYFCCVVQTDAAKGQFQHFKAVVKRNTGGFFKRRPKRRDNVYPARVNGFEGRRKQGCVPLWGGSKLPP